ncbi:hypothetical protein V6N00_15240 [Tersicoccus sp. MR15.9]|uniref:hypothetical protein n=1 Tax=Tersicoccus mangrovi TaxID=3121635 RepID=UPI002FE616C6
MEAIRSWLVRLFLLPARRRNWMFVGMVAVWYVTVRLIVAPLDRHSPLLWVVGPVLSYGGLFSLVHIRYASTTGMLFGRLLPLPRRELVRFAADRFWDVETWDSPASSAEVLERLASLTTPATPTLVQRLPDALFLRLRRWHQPEPWPSSAPLPRRIRVQARLLFLVEDRLDGGSTVDAHWDSEPRLTDAMRARAQLGRDVVDAARALTEQADRGSDPTPGNDR